MLKRIETIPDPLQDVGVKDDVRAAVRAALEMRCSGMCTLPEQLERSMMALARQCFRAGFTMGWRVREARH